MKKAIVAVVVAALLGGGGWYAYKRYDAQTSKGPQYKTVAVERGSISATVTATGTLSALVTVQVGSQVSGRLTEINVDFNSQVKKGQILAKLDPQLLVANVTQQQANVMAAQGSVARADANASSAKQQYERAKALFEGSIGNKADVDTAQATLAAAVADKQVARGSLQQASASLQQARINLSYAVIYSPIDGVVISRAVDVGQTVAASLSAPVLFTIAGDLRQMQVDSNVTEGDVGKLRPDMPALFTVDAYPTQNFKGTVRQIRNSPTTVQNVVTYDAVIDVQNPDLLLKPGMTANVKFVYADQEAVLKIPNAALRFKPPPEVLAAASSAPPSPQGSGSAAGAGSGAPEGRQRGQRGQRGQGAPGASDTPGADRPTTTKTPPKAVWVLRDGQIMRVPVKIGISDGSVSEVLDGRLQEGDQVVTEVIVAGDKPATPAAQPTGGGNRGGGVPGMGRVL
jgi:HlyD family secretion protein